MSIASKFGTIVLAAAAVTLGAGCTKLVARANGMTDYREFRHDGRIYVLSRPATIDSFLLSKEVPYRVTRIGAGPGGETVVFEADAKDPFLSDALIAMYKAKH